MAVKLVECVFTPGVRWPAAARLRLEVPSLDGEHWDALDKTLTVDVTWEVFRACMTEFEEGDGHELTALQARVMIGSQTLAELDLSHVLKNPRPRVVTGASSRGAFGSLIDGVREVMGHVDLGRIFPGLDPQRQSAMMAATRIGLMWPTTRAEVEAKYRFLAQQYHPDKGGDARKFAQLHQDVALLRQVTT